MVATGLINNSVYFTLKKNKFEKKIGEGVEYHQAIREVSEGLNHFLERKNITLFYLSKA